MTRSLSADLRGRVIAAIEEGLSTREAARRFQVGISTAGSWYRRYRATGETVARKQGQPSRSKLDPHEVFILGLIEETPDITLAEIAERLAAEHRVRVVPSTVWMFLDKHDVTFKKRRRMPASSNVPKYCAAAEPGSTPTRSRPKLIFIDGDRRVNKDGAVARTGQRSERCRASVLMDIGRLRPSPPGCG
jgi:transposase